MEALGWWASGDGEMVLQRLPLTVVQGFLDVGKTGLQSALLAQAGERRLARLAFAGLPRLAAELRRMTVEASVDHVVVELPAVEDESVLSDVWHSPFSDELRWCDVAELTSIVTLIDAERFLFDLSSEADANEQGAGLAAGGRQRVALVLARQVESAHVLVITNAERSSRAHLRLLEAVLAELNPDARIAVASHGQVLGVRLLDGQLPQSGPFGNGQGDMLDVAALERASLGVSSVEYQARRPFHPARLRRHLLAGWPGVLRSKGIFWIATRMGEVGAWSQVGPVWEVSRAGFWWSALEEQGWPIPSGIAAQIRESWAEPFGDRRQDLVLSGLDLDRQELLAGLDACLLTEQELASGPDAWQRLEDPFPCWSGLATPDIPASMS